MVIIVDNQIFKSMEELADYDIESILLNRVGDLFPHHQTINAVCDAVWLTISDSVEQKRSEKHDYTRKISNNAAIVADLSSQIKDVQNKLSTVTLQQQVLEKQINNISKQQEKVQEEIADQVCQERNYALEIVDLNQDLEEIKTSNKLTWDSMKRVGRAYSSALQFRIQINDCSEAGDKIQISFFKTIKEEPPQYYVDMTRTADSWKIDLIHPPLSPKSEEQLKGVTNLEKPLRVSDITAFLCSVRKIFKQQYQSSIELQS